MFERRTRGRSGGSGQPELTAAVTSFEFGIHSPALTSYREMMQRAADLARQLDGSDVNSEI